MSHGIDGARGHGGICAFCGTSVHQGYITCTGCGATWRSLVNGWGRLMINCAEPAGLFAGFVSVGAFRSFGAAAAVFVGVSICMMMLGVNTRTRAWYR